MESNNILVGEYKFDGKNFKIFLDDSCGCIFGYNKNIGIQPLLFHPGNGNREGPGLTKLGITNLRDITWYHEIFDHIGFDFDDLVKKHPLWITDDKNNITVNKE